MKCSIGPLAWLVLAASTLITSTFATTFFEQPLPENVAQTEVILRGTVGANTVKWGERDDGGRALFTYYDFEVSEVLKGQVDARRIQIRIIGGEKDGVGVSVPGAPKLKRGEDLVMLLVVTQGDGSYDVRGLMLGKFDVKRAADGTEYIEGPGINPTNRTGIMALHEPGEEGHSDHDHGQEDKKEEPVQPWTMDRLRELIKTQAVAAESKKPLISPSSAPSPDAAGVSLAPPTDPAPALQNQEGEAQASREGGGDSAPITSIWVWISGLLAVVVSAAWMLKKKG